MPALAPVEVPDYEDELAQILKREFLVFQRKILELLEKDQLAIPRAVHLIQSHAAALHGLLSETSDGSCMKSSGIRSGIHFATQRNMSYAPQESTPGHQYDALQMIDTMRGFQETQALTGALRNAIQIGDPEIVRILTKKVRTNLGLETQEPEVAEPLLEAP